MGQSGLSSYFDPTNPIDARAPPPYKPPPATGDPKGKPEPAFARDCPSSGDLS